MLLAVRHRVIMHAGSLESIKKQEFLRLVQLLRFFRVRQTSRVRYYSMMHPKARIAC